MYAALYLNRPIPGKNTVQRNIMKFEAKGNVINNCTCKARQEPKKNARNDRDLQEILCVEER